MTGGADGLQGMNVVADLRPLPLRSVRPHRLYLLRCVVLFLGWLVVRAIVHSPFGRSLTGIRENVAAHARDRRAGARGACSRLHDLGGAGRASPAR